MDTREIYEIGEIPPPGRVPRYMYAQLIRASAGTVRPVRFDVAHLAVRGDVVLAEWEIEAEHRASGARLRWRGMSVAEYRDGLIIWWREYWNPSALGLPS